MIYVFDTSSLIVLFRNFYPDSFPSLWRKFNASVAKGQYVSVKEVRLEADSYHETDYLKEWTKTHKEFFLPPSDDEMEFISKMFNSVPHFQNLISSKSVIGGKPVADPFVIAKAKIFKGNVISEEKFKDNAVKIPNVCKHFNVPHCSLKDFMKQEGWKF